MRPAEELRVGDLVIRRYRVSDAAALHDAVIESLEHLRPFMAWIAEEPVTVAERERLIERWNVGWEEGTDFVYGVFLADVIVGGFGMHRRIGPGGIEIGYWVRARYTGRGYATAVADVLTDAAFTVEDITHVEIHHDKANIASRRVPEKLGYELVCEVDEGVTAPATTGISCHWRMSRARQQSRST